MGGGFGSGPQCRDSSPPNCHPNKNLCSPMIAFWKIKRHQTFQSWNLWHHVLLDPIIDTRCSKWQTWLPHKEWTSSLLIDISIVQTCSTGWLRSTGRSLCCSRSSVGLKYVIAWFLLTDRVTAHHGAMAHCHYRKKKAQRHSPLTLTLKKGQQL